MLDNKIKETLIEQGRAFTRGYVEKDPYKEEFVSDQEQKLPQPPLVKAAVTPVEAHIPLTKDFQSLALKNNLIDLIRDRRSARIYTQESMTLDQLSFLLYHHRLQHRRCADHGL